MAQSRTLSQVSTLSSQITDVSEKVSEVQQNSAKVLTLDAGSITPTNLDFTNCGTTSYPSSLGRQGTGGSASSYGKIELYTSHIAFKIPDIELGYDPSNKQFVNSISSTVTNDVSIYLKSGSFSKSDFFWFDGNDTFDTEMSANLERNFLNKKVFEYDENLSANGTFTISLFPIVNGWGMPGVGPNSSGPRANFTITNGVISQIKVTSSGRHTFQFETSTSDSARVSKWIGVQMSGVNLATLNASYNGISTIL